MKRVKIIKTDDNKLYIIPYELSDMFFALTYGGEQFIKTFEDYRIGNINDIELYVRQSPLYR